MTATLAYQTRFSIPTQLDTPPTGWRGPSDAALSGAQLLQQLQARPSSMVNVPIAKALNVFGSKADQLRQSYDSTLHQARQTAHVIIRQPKFLDKLIA